VGRRLRPAGVAARRRGRTPVMRPDTNDGGPAAPSGRPETTEDQRGEGQPADPRAVDDAAEEAEALERPPSGA
jgi:hypothetical protein